MVSGFFGFGFLSLGFRWPLLLYKSSSVFHILYILANWNLECIFGNPDPGIFSPRYRETVLMILHKLGSTWMNFGSGKSHVLLSKGKISICACIYCLNVLGILWKRLINVHVGTQIFPFSTFAH